MKITWGRWVAACVVVCALVATALLPSDPFADRYGDQSLYQWGIAKYAPLEHLSMRDGRRANHADALWRAYRTRLTMERSRQLLAGRSATAGEPFVWIDGRLTGSLRDSVSASLARDRAERGEWHGHAAVALIVTVDTLDPTVEHYEYPNRRFTTQIFPPSADNSGFCVTVLRISPLDVKHNYVSKLGRLLDGCAFYDAFGSPGPQVAKWMEAQAFGYTRTLSFAPADTGRARPLRTWDYGDPYAARCGGGDPNACLQTIGENEGDDAALNDWLNLVDYHYVDRSVPDWPHSREWRLPLIGTDHGTLGDMVRELGPARFQRVWTSKLALPEAYAEVTGEPLATWIQRRVIAEYGQTYQIGPLPRTFAIFAALLTCIVGFAIAIRLARRPYAV